MSGIGEAATAQKIVTPGLIEDVQGSLGRGGQKTLSSKYLYDELGSVLFEAITYLPEYGLTDADERILRDHAKDIVRKSEPPVTVVELGSGSGRKVGWLLRALADQGETTYRPIDISAQAIAQCEAELGHIDHVHFDGIVKEYFDGLHDAATHRTSDERLLVLFIGSTIGNFDRPVARRFLERLRAEMREGDRLLLGTDLVKPAATLIAAYNDPPGVTAAFNRNVLARLNRELGAEFDLSTFEHHVLWNESARRIEMHLRSTVDQTVRIPAADLVVTFRAGETIWTESSHKFLREEPAEMGRAAGFREAGQWIDREWPFAETLLVAE